MDAKEFEEFTKVAKEQEYNWNNYFTEVKIGDQVVQYKGYWNKNRSQIIGLGETKFKDGSIY